MSILRTAGAAIFLLVLAVSMLQAGTASIVDGDTLKIDNVTYRLFGIDAPEHGQKCADANGGNWPCGSEATKALKELTLGLDVQCDDRGQDGYGRTIGLCHADGIDLNREMVRAGRAWAFVKYSDRYVSQESQARKAALGIWQAQTQTPWDFRAEKWSVAAQEAPTGCPIKGNISDSGMIYHTPWSPWYRRTRINTKRGERWFCDEDEAIEAGWRAPLWGN